MVSKQLASETGAEQGATPVEVSRRSFRAPPVTVAQMVLVPLLIGILVGFWVTPADLSTQDLLRVDISNKRPIVSVMSLKSARFVDAESNRQLCNLELGVRYPQLERSTLTRWYRWPSAESEPARVAELFARSLREFEIQFFAEDSLAIISQGSKIMHRTHTVVHLQSGKHYVHDETSRTNYSPMEFAKVDRFVVGVQRQNGPDAVDAPLGFPPMEGHKSLIGEVMMVIDPQAGPVELSEAQQKRILNAFAVRRWQYHRGIWNSEPTTISKEDRAAAENDHGIEFCERDLKPISWTTSAGQWVEYANPGQTESDSTSKYWLANSHSSPPTRVAWPFRIGETFERIAYVPNQPAVCGMVRTAHFRSLGITERSVYWNLATGRVIELPGVIYDARQFGDRLLVSNSSGASWIDLTSGKVQQQIINLNSQSRPTFIYAVVLWLAAWLYCVRPIQECDLSRRFGVCFLLLSVAALSLGQLDGLGLHLEWQQAEWLSACALMVFLLAIVIAITIRLRVSWLLLGAAWPITLFFLVSLAIESNAEVYEPTSTAAPSGAWSQTTLRASIWRHITDPNGFTRARLDPAETPHLGTTWDGEPHFGVRPLEDSE